jgi:DNA-binding YbaB/EbfC family protein
MEEPGFLNLFKNVPKFKQMLQQAGDMRDRLAQLESQLAERQVEGEAGAGAVRVVMNGKMQVLQVRLDRPLLASLAPEGSGQDQQIIEELIAAAVNAAGAKAREMIEQEMRKATGGLDLPGLGGLFGGVGGGDPGP